MSVDFSNDCGAEVDERDLTALASYVMDQMLIAEDAELSIACVTPEEIAVLHEDYLDEPGPTDVMSFPMDELRPGTAGQPRPTGILGDVVLCPQFAQAQALAAGHPLPHELRILLAHGILHLLGYDHAEPQEEAAMFALQRSLVQRYEAMSEPQP